jgi:small subunit ribosomal protein S18
MKNKLFVSNIDFEVTTDLLREMFEEIAPVLNAVIALDRESKRSKGFAFIEMETEAGATTAIEGLNNKPINGRPMKVCHDRGKANEGEEKGKKREYLPPIQRMQLFRRRKKMDPFVDDPTKTVEYKDLALLSRFVSERGSILSRRLTGLSAYHQRKVSKAVKRAQSLGMMPYSR